MGGIFSPAQTGARAAFSKRVIFLPRAKFTGNSGKCAERNGIPAVLSSSPIHFSSACPEEVPADRAYEVVEYPPQHEDTIIMLLIFRNLFALFAFQKKIVA